MRFLCQCNYCGHQWKESYDSEADIEWLQNIIECPKCADSDCTIKQYKPPKYY